MLVTSATQLVAAGAIATNSPLSLLGAISVVGIALPLLDDRECARRALLELVPAAAVEAAFAVLFADEVAVVC